MAGNQQVVKELLGSQAEQQVKITRGVGTYFKEGSHVEQRKFSEIKLSLDFCALSRLPFSLNLFFCKIFFSILEVE